MNKVESVFIYWLGGIIWKWEDAFSKIFYRGATGAHFTGAIGQGVFIIFFQKFLEEKKFMFFMNWLSSLKNCTCSTLVLAL